MNVLDLTTSSEDLKKDDCRGTVLARLARLLTWLLKSREANAKAAIAELAICGEARHLVFESGNKMGIQVWLDQYRGCLARVECYRDTSTIMEFAKNANMISCEGKPTGETLYDRLYRR
jgi:hypothetical protein